MSAPLPGSGGEVAVHVYSQGQEKREYDGYFWFQLADIFSLAALIHGGTEKRALVCRRCGSLVAFPELHDQWHAKGGPA